MSTKKGCRIFSRRVGDAPVRFGGSHDIDVSERAVAPVLKLLMTRTTIFACLAAMVPASICIAQTKSGAARVERRFSGLLGPSSKKIKREGDKTWLWAGPRRKGPSNPDAQWYEFTGASIPPEQLQFGIGKDSIRAIDDPLFVKPDDPRLLKIARSVYRRDEKPASLDELPVIGYATGGVARAYPVALLDRHELVNDKIGGKPVTVGW